MDYNQQLASLILNITKLTGKNSGEISDQVVISWVFEQLSEPLLKSFVLVSIKPSKQIIFETLANEGTLKYFLLRACEIYFPKKSIPELNTIFSETKSNYEVNPTINETEYDSILHFGENFSAQANDGKFDHYSITPHVNDLRTIIYQEDMGNSIIIGPAGTGKTTVAKVFSRENPQITLLSIAPANFLSSTKFRGDLEERSRNIFDTGSKANANSIKLVLFIDEIHFFFSDFTLLNIIKPYLSDSKIRIIGATTTAEFSKFIQPHETILRRFVKIELLQPTEDFITQAIEKLVLKKSKYHRIQISPELVASMYLLVFSLFPTKILDSFNRIIDLAMSHCNVQRNSTNLSMDNLVYAISRVSNLSNDEIINLL